MLATHPPSQSFHSSPSTARLCASSSSRLALADSTNVNLHSDACGLGSPKNFAHLASCARTGCGWSDATGSVSAPSHPRSHYLSSTPSPFTMTYKAPPTVCISFSAACSQGSSIPREQSCGTGAQGLEPADFSDARSVVPFPTTPLDGDMDVEMLDGTCVPCPDGHYPSAGQPLRKRRSAHSSVSSSPGSLGKDAKQKRPRKSKRQVAELWWLGVVHRSVLRSIEAHHFTGELESFQRSLSGSCDLDTMDRMLVERIQKRLAENGCVEGRLPTCPLPRISSPNMAVSSLNLLAPSRKTLPISLPRSSQLNQKENNTLDETATPLPAPKASPCTSLSITSYSTFSSTTSVPHTRHVRFEIPQRPRQLQSRSSILRRSPSPPARTGTVTADAQTLTLTMPQLVASLTLAYRERSRSRLRGRTCRPVECGKTAGRLASSVPFQVVQCGDGVAIQDKDRMHHPSSLRARLSNVPERKSPLSRVTYAEGAEW